MDLLAVTRVAAARAGVMLCALYLIHAPALRAELVFESAASGPTGQVGPGSIINEDAFIAVNFPVFETVQIGRIGAHLFAFGAGNSVFGAIVALSGPNDFPDAADLSSDDFRAAAVIQSPLQSRNVSANLRVTLTPGWYALVLGSGRFGATGLAGAVSNNIPVGTVQVYAIRQSDGAILPQNPAVRLFVDTATVPEIIRIADTDTIIPGGSITFSSFTAPAIRIRRVVFRATSLIEELPPLQGIYTALDGTLQTQADTETVLPGGDFFAQFGAGSSFDGETVTFQARTVLGRQGIYRVSADALTVLVDDQTPLPTGDDDHLIEFAPQVSADAGNIAFSALDQDGRPGIYTQINGTLGIIANLETPLPGGLGFFEVIPLQFVSLDAGRVAFRAGSVSEFQFGLYHNRSGPLSALADLNTSIPNGSSTFGQFGTPVMRAGRIAFAGAEFIAAPVDAGIYTDFNGELQPVVDLSTPAPAGDGTLSEFLDPAFDGRHVAFIAFDAAGNRAVYTDLNGPVEKVIAVGDALDGRIVNAIRISPSGIDLSRIAVAVDFTDGSSGIYVARYAPPPGDADEDGDVDLLDFARFMACFNTDVTTPLTPACEPFDLNGDAAVDLSEFQAFRNCTSAPGIRSSCNP